MLSKSLKFVGVAYFLCHCYKEKARKNKASTLEAYAHPTIFPGLRSWNRVLFGLIEFVWLKVKSYMKKSIQLSKTCV